MRIAAAAVVVATLVAGCATAPRRAPEPKPASEAKAEAKAAKRDPAQEAPAPALRVVRERRLAGGGRELELEGPFWGLVEYLDGLPDDEVVPRLRLRTHSIAEHVVLSIVLRLGGEEVPAEARAAVSTVAVVARLNALSEAIPRRVYLDAYQEDEGSVWLSGRSATPQDVDAFLAKLAAPPCRFGEVERRTLAGEPPTQGHSLLRFTATALVSCSGPEKR